MSKRATRLQKKIVLDACKGLSSNSVGLQAGVSTATLNNWRKNKSSKPQMDPLLRVAAFVRVKRKVLDAARA